MSGLRARLNAWHRQSAELHILWETISRELAVLDERRRALDASHASLMADQERAADELLLARDRSAEVEKEGLDSKQEYQEAAGQLAAAKEALQKRQDERSRLETALADVRSRIETHNVLRSENQARLDELSARIGSRREKLGLIQQNIAEVEAAARLAEENLRAARRRREEAESQLTEAEARLRELAEGSGDQG